MINTRPEGWYPVSFRLVIDFVVVENPDVLVPMIVDINLRLAYGHSYD